MRHCAAWSRRSRSSSGMPMTAGLPYPSTASHLTLVHTSASQMRLSPPRARTSTSALCFPSSNITRQRSFTRTPPSPSWCPCTGTRPECMTPTSSPTRASHLLPQASAWQVPMTHSYMCMFVYVYVCMHVYLCVCVCLCVCVWVYISYIYTYVYIYICKYTYIGKGQQRLLLFSRPGRRGVRFGPQHARSRLSQRRRSARVTQGFGYGSRYLSEGRRLRGARVGLRECKVPGDEARGGRVPCQVSRQEPHGSRSFRAAKDEGAGQWRPHAGAGVGAPGWRWRGFMRGPEKEQDPRTNKVSPAYELARHKRRAWGRWRPHGLGSAPGARGDEGAGARDERNLGVYILKSSFYSGFI
jgi:hypothetical protein